MLDYYKYFSQQTCWVGSDKCRTYSQADITPLTEVLQTTVQKLIKLSSLGLQEEEGGRREYLSKSSILVVFYGDENYLQVALFSWHSNIRLGTGKSPTNDL